MFESHHIQWNVFQHYYQSYCDYLLKMDGVHEEQALFKQYFLSVPSHLIEVLATEKAF